MTDEQIALARRAVACRGWRWMPWMLAHAPDSGVEARVQKVDGEVLEVCLNDWYGVTWLAHRVVPDLSDPATLGCFLALVREAWGDPEAHLALGAAGWILLSGESRVADVVYPSPAGRTEAHALVAALEAAHAEGGDRREEE